MPKYLSMKNKENGKAYHHNIRNLTQKIMFPIIQMYSKVARFNTIQYDKNHKPRVIANVGCGFFYTYENQAYFVTDRNYVIIEEKAFLPDSIIIHQNGIERQT